MIWFHTIPNKSENIFSFRQLYFKLEEGGQRRRIQEDKIPWWVGVKSTTFSQVFSLLRNLGKVTR